MIATIYNDKKQVVGWDTTCFDCGDPVRFTKGDHWKKNHATKMPDTTARCWDCWQRIVDKELTK